MVFQRCTYTTTLSSFIRAIAVDGIPLIRKTCHNSASASDSDMLSAVIRISTPLILHFSALI